MNVFGLDGAPQGWSVAYQDSEGRILLTLVRDLSEFIHRFPQATHVAIDMIIGLPEHAKKGGREAELSWNAVNGALNYDVDLKLTSSSTWSPRGTRRPRGP